MAEAPGRLALGRFQLGPCTIEVIVDPDGCGATAWLERVAPGPRAEIGHAVDLDLDPGPEVGPRLRLYGHDWEPGAHAEAVSETAAIWKRAVAEGVLKPRPSNSALVPLGAASVDGRRVTLVWCTLDDSVLANFTDIEPKRIGTVVMRSCGPAFVAQPGHLDWLRHENREARLLRAAVRLHPRPTVDGPRHY